jgi:hypothetical protein
MSLRDDDTLRARSELRSVIGTGSTECIAPFGRGCIDRVLKSDCQSDAGRGGTGWSLSDDKVGDFRPT